MEETIAKSEYELNRQNNLNSLLTYHKKKDKTYPFSSVQERVKLHQTSCVFFLSYGIFISIDMYTVSTSNKFIYFFFSEMELPK